MSRLRNITRAPTHHGTIAKVIPVLPDANGYDGARMSPEEMEAEVKKQLSKRCVVITYIIKFISVKL